MPEPPPLPAGLVAAPDPPAPDNPCATCGACCRSYVVPVCGYDIWLISTQQRLSPRAFLVACPMLDPKPEGYRLTPGGPSAFLALDKQRRFSLSGRCIFLVGLAGGHDRCGIYDQRPCACRTYPMLLHEGTVEERAEALCPPGAWPGPPRPAWRVALQRQRMHYVIYYEVVARWNARVDAAPAGAVLTSHEYYSYLLNVYDRLAHVAPGIDALAAGVHVTPGGPSPWLAYAEQARAVIAGFYPWLDA